jgi:O-antigen/teichoic acid export membrane protein
MLRFAVIASAASKAFGLVLQTVAIPLVYRALGQHRYELYLLLTAALATITLAQVGAGPGLTQGIAKANAAQRRDEEASLFNAAIRLTAAASLIGGFLILAVIYALPTETLFGPAFSADRSSILTASNVCVLVLMATMLFGIVDSALAGYQEQVFAFTASAIANIISIALLYLVCRYAPTIVNVVVVLYGVPTLARVVNLFVLYRRRPYLLRASLQSCRGFYLILMNVGLAFWIIQIGGLLEQHTGTYMLAHLSSTQATNLFAIAFKALTLAGAAVAIVTQPLWPAITDALAHRDIEWVKRSYTKIRRALSVYSCTFAILIIARGEWFLQHIWHIDSAGDQSLFVLLGVYFVANTWTHLFYMILMGMRVIWHVAGIVLAENVLMLAFGMFFVPRFGAAGMALAYLTASAVLPAWLLPRLMSAEIRRISVLPAA